MAHPLGDPAALRALAAQLDQQANGLQNLGDRVGRAMPATAWRSPRAERFRGELGQRRTESHRVATEVTDLARDVRREADAIEGRIRWLTGLQRRVQDRIYDLQRLKQALPFSTPFDPRRLPSSAHPDWEKVARLFGIR